MNEAELVALIRAGVSAGTPSRWAELGSGDGNFTLALGALLGAGSDLYSVDRDREALQRQRGRLRDRPLAARVITIEADFRLPLDLAGLDGVLMANSLHFQPDQAGVLRLVRSYLGQVGRLLVVEYASPWPRPWVPHPVPPARLERLAAEAGFARTETVAEREGRFGDRMYSAIAYLT